MGLIRFCKFLCLVLLYLESVRVCDASVGVCLTNCVQCKKMFGPYFQGRACGDACVLTSGLWLPDCNIPKTFLIFLNRLY